MKIFSILVLKDEIDIIQYTIDKALIWSDYIFVIDNMSTDGSWELIEETYRHNPKVKIWGRYGGEFRDAVRQLVFNKFESELNFGDWICRLDADEEYIDNPKEFLAALPVKSDCVYNRSFQFYYTRENYEYELKNGYQSFNKHLSYYLPNHSEIRFAKYTRYTFWLQNQGWPEASLLYPAREEIRLKHYQYRSLGQMKKRTQNRSVSPDPKFFGHEREELKAWYKKLFNYEPISALELQNRIVPSHLLIYDDGNYSEYKRDHSSPKMPMRIIMKLRGFLYNTVYKKINKYKY